MLYHWERLCARHASEIFRKWADSLPIPGTQIYAFPFATTIVSGIFDCTYYCQWDDDQRKIFRILWISYFDASNISKTSQWCPMDMVQINCQLDCLLNCQLHCSLNSSRLAKWKHESFALLTLCKGNPRCPVDSPHKGPILMLHLLHHRDETRFWKCLVRTAMSVQVVDIQVIYFIR